MDAKEEIRSVIRSIKHLEKHSNNLPEWKGKVIKNISHYLLMDLKMLVNQMYYEELKDEFK